MILSAVSILTIALTSCNSHGNTGNGANDPTAEFETDKVKHTGGSDTINTSSTVPVSVDTTTEDKTR